jgi:WD40 repeat protein
MLGVHYSDNFTISKKLPIQFCTSHSTDPIFLCVPSQQCLNIYDAFRGDLLDKFHAHYDTIHCVTYHPFRQECFTGSSDHTIISYKPQKDLEKEEEEIIIFPTRSFSQDYFSEED